MSNFISSPGGQPIALIMAGGTGGHVYPGLAIAKALVKKGYKIVWLGSNGGMEKKLVAKQAEAFGFDIPYHEIAISGVRGKSKLTYLAAPVKIMKAVSQAKKILFGIKPSIVIGMGGFASGPGAFAAWRMNIPVIIHEQNAVAGTTNRLASRFATRVLLAFPGTIKNGEHIGNPVRDDIREIASPEDRFNSRSGAIRLLVLGGSRGAQFINSLLPATLKQLDGKLDINVIHQAGSNKYEQTKMEYSQADVKADVRPFIDDMAEVIAWADIAICRAGALTVSELAAAGLGAVYIPFPHAIGDHQTKNAGFMAQNKAAQVKSQTLLTPDSFAKVLNDLFLNRETLSRMAINAKKQDKPNAVDDFTRVCDEVIYA